MKISVLMTEADIRQVLSDFILDTYRVKIEPNQLHIKVKSKQNCKFEWETADIKLEVNIIDSSDT